MTAATVRFRPLVLVVAFFLAPGWLTQAGAETLPPPPAAYFNDYARVVPAATVQALNARLEQFERDTSNQLLVAVFSRMDSASSIEDYTVRLAQSWRVGQKAKSNGAVLFVFVADRKLYIQVGYGLEGALPDATCKAIIEQEIKPRFRTGDYAGGLTGGVTAMIAATQGEYRGTGRTQADRAPRGGSGGAIGLFIFIIIVAALSRLGKGGHTYGNPVNRHRSAPGWWLGSGGGGGGSRGSGRSGGGFSGGGGSFGGGGSGGSW